MPADAIFSILVPRGSTATCRIVCFPWSGGGTSVYSRWGRCLPDFIEIVAVRLKGRESRYMQDVFKTKEEIVDEVVGGKCYPAGWNRRFRKHKIRLKN